MTIERARPLPIGRYWAIVRPRNLLQFEAWLAFARARSAVAVEVSSHFDETTDGEAFDFAIWQTNTLLVWPDVDMGFAPNVAGPDVHSYDDTVQKPPPATASEILGLDELASATKVTLAVVGGLAVVVLLAVLVPKFGRRRSR
jgi:hypothetical protein